MIGSRAGQWRSEMIDAPQPAFDSGPLEEFATREQIIEILSAFTEHCDRAVPELRSAVRERRVEAVERAAHSLAGSAGTVGAPAVSGAARELCALARGEGAGGAAAGPEHFDQALDRLLDATGEARAEIDRYVAGV